MNNNTGKENTGKGDGGKIIVPGGKGKRIPDAPGAVEWFETRDKCVEQMKTPADIMSIISSVLLIIAIVVLLRKKKNRHFPHNLIPLLCLAILCQTGSRALEYFFSFNDFAENHMFFCWWPPIIQVFGFIPKQYIWAASLVVLYQAVVLQKPIYKIRAQKKFFYAFLSVMFIGIVLVQTVERGVIFAPHAGRCLFRKTSPGFRLFQLTVNGLIAMTVFLILGIPIVKTLLSKKNREHIDQSRVLLLTDAAVQQILLAFVMFFEASVKAYQGIEDFATQSYNATFVSWFFSGMQYTMCIAQGISICLFGGLAALVLLWNREKAKVVTMWIGRTFGIRGNSKNSSTNGDDSTVLIPYKNMSTPSKKKNNFSQFPSAVDNHAVSGCSAIPEWQNTVQTSNVLLFAIDQLEIDGVHLNEAEMESFVSELNDAHTIGMDESHDSLKDDPRLHEAKLKYYEKLHQSEQQAANVEVNLTE